jgi:hypothetical protein
MTGQGHPKLAMMHVSFFGAVSGGNQQAEQGVRANRSSAFSFAFGHIAHGTHSSDSMHISGYLQFSDIGFPFLR